MTDCPQLYTPVAYEYTCYGTVLPTYLTPADNFFFKRKCIATYVVYSMQP